MAQKKLVHPKFGYIYSAPALGAAKGRKKSAGKKKRAPKAKTSVGCASKAQLKAANKKSGCSKYKLCIKADGKTKSFTVKRGKSCLPPSRSHLKPFQSRFKRAAQECKGMSKSQFLSCVKGRMEVPRSKWSKRASAR